MEMKLDKITAVYEKTINSFDMNVSAITPKKLLNPMNNLLMISSNGH